ncbi:hypothetical protein FLP41_01685 (plasmid) [Paracoccus marcusii]|uniref:hypothetical protein n=1 Tax=Paracoccus marcusii TaxID=59779 RepID=UPI002ED1C319|nr:hypothetical protein FLP41_01685 [Paracoccus marcusii]
MISVQLAEERGITNGAVRVFGKRGRVWASGGKPVSLQPLIWTVPVHVVGTAALGLRAAAKKGWGPNSLTPFIGDANTNARIRRVPGRQRTRNRGAAA